MYLKVIKINIKNTDLWCWAVSRGVYNCDEFDWMDAASVSAPEWSVKGWLQGLVLFDWIPS